MGKAVAITPIYFSFAWALLLSYQVFTETAVNTVLIELHLLWPEVGLFLSDKTELIVFVIAYSWIFLLSSVIPSIILGKKSGTLVQFLVVLVLTSSTIAIKDLVSIYTGLDTNLLFSLTKYLTNPLDALTYLAFPYIIMMLVDFFNKK
jgi:hypothetical protein